MIPKRIYLPYFFDCAKCGTKLIIDIPYIYNYTTKDGKNYIIDIYIKDGLDKKPDLCNCDGIYNKFSEEYKRIDYIFEVKH